jgi:hypothetical protein
MSWVKLDDQIATHPKILKAGPSAAWLWVCSIAYAQNHFTDGFISDAALGHLGMPKHQAKQLASRCVKHSLWERVKGGFQVHDYLHHNASAEQRRQIVFEHQKAGRIGGLRSAQTRRSRRHSGSKQFAEATVKRPAEANVNDPAEPHSSPLRSAPYKEGAPTARPDDRTNTGGNGSAERRRDAPDAAGGGASAPVARRPEMTDNDANAILKKHGLL